MYDNLIRPISVRKKDLENYNCAGGYRALVLKIVQREYKVLNSTVLVKMAITLEILLSSLILSYRLFVCLW